MSDYDLVLLHAPSVYDFRQEAILYGPVADFVPAPFVFETYPLGYTALVEYLERGGYRVQLMNLAAHMLDVPDFDAEAAIATLNPIAFVIDFHWLAHAQGALAVAQIVKTFHPETRSSWKDLRRHIFIVSWWIIPRLITFCVAIRRKIRCCV
jgi:hypothetical protein